MDHVSKGSIERQSNQLNDTESTFRQWFLVGLSFVGLSSLFNGENRIVGIIFLAVALTTICFALLSSVYERYYIKEPDTILEARFKQFIVYRLIILVQLVLVFIVFVNLIRTQTPNI